MKHTRRFFLLSFPCMISLNWLRLVAMRMKIRITHRILNISRYGPKITAVFDFPLKEGNFPPRVAELEKITDDLGEPMRGGFTYGEISRALYSLGFQIDTYMPPEKVQKEYFDGRADGMRAFENVSLISATYTAGYNFE